MPLCGAATVPARNDPMLADSAGQAPTLSVSTRKNKDERKGKKHKTGQDRDRFERYQSRIERGQQVANKLAKSWRGKFYGAPRWETLAQRFLADPSFWAASVSEGRSLDSLRDEDAEFADQMAAAASSRPPPDDPPPPAGQVSKAATSAPSQLLAAHPKEAPASSKSKGRGKSTGSLQTAEAWLQQPEQSSIAKGKGKSNKSSKPSKGQAEKGQSGGKSSKGPAEKGKSGGKYFKGYAEKGKPSTKDKYGSKSRDSSRSADERAYKSPRHWKGGKGW